jgi:peptidoglycan/LPS O-acetylase OafA/YrhL
MEKSVKLSDVAQEPKKIRLNVLQAFRLFAFLMIFRNHVWRLIPCSIDFGARGVEIFIILSGFLMSYCYYNKNIACTWYESFLICKKKLLKFYPLHVIMFLACIPLVINRISTIEEIKRVIINGVINLLLLQSWFTDPYIYAGFNSATWYLSAILVCYFMTPVIFAVIRKYRNNLLILIWGLFLLRFSLEYIRIHVPNIITFSVHSSPIFRLMEYAIGCVLGVIFLENGNIKKYKNIYVYSLLEVGLVVVYILAVKYGNDTWLRVYYILIVSLIVYVFALEKGLFSKMLSNRFFVHFGNISFELFMVHVVIIMYATEQIPQISNPFIECIIILIICVIIAEIIQITSLKIFRNK